MNASGERLRTIVTFVVFQLIWFACVLGAGRGHEWVGPLSLVVLLPITLLFVEDRRAEARLWLEVGILGTLIDSGLLAAGLIEFPLESEGWPPLLVPLWISSLWVAFASLLRSCLTWMRGRTWLAALFGFVGGPLSFRAGAQLGAVGVPEPQWQGFLALAVEWAVLTPLLIAWGARGEGEPAEAAPTIEQAGA